MHNLEDVLESILGQNDTEKDQKGAQADAQKQNGNKNGVTFINVTP